ncbi:cuticle protein 19-like [Chironomus tepperi]|uniref:cuticle protein 19-like n=1 Tax=Chironomus tepperi TaxID=113505 RepID=UPI00391F7F24
MKLLVVFVAFLAVVAALPHELSHGYKVQVKHDLHHYPVHQPLVHEPEYYHKHHDEDFHAYPKYKFEYGVKDPHTGDHKSQWEIRDGDVVKGEYTLDEADGTKRIVSYEANDKTGFNAVVKKIGHAVHPEHYKQHGYGY